MPHLESVNREPCRTDVWSRANSHCQVRYQLSAEAEADVLCRVLNHFALQSLVPQQVAVLQRDGQLHIEVALDGLSWHRAGVIAEKLRNLISVESVTLEPIELSRLHAAG